MKQGMKKQLVLSATVGGIFLFAPVVLAAEEQNAPTVEEVTGSNQVSSETSTLSEVATSQGIPTVTASSSENTATGQTSETRLLAMTDDQASQETKEVVSLFDRIFTWPFTASNSFFNRLISVLSSFKSLEGFSNVSTLLSSCSIILIS